MTVPLTQTTGRRKEAVARVRLRPGTGTITINSRAFDNYFTSATDALVGVIKRIRDLAVRCAQQYLASREALGFPLLERETAHA